MASISDILIAFQAQDEVTPVMQQIQASAGQMGGGFRQTLGQLGNVFSGLNGLIMGAFGMYGLTSFKQMTYGAATAREEVKGLYNATIMNAEGMAELEKSMPMTLWDRMDNLTNRGYVQLDQLTQAMNVFSMSSHANAAELWNMAETMDKVGNYAIQMGYDEFHTMQLMMGVSKGLNGSMQMLNSTFGLTKSDLMNLGWSGAKNDVEGYRKALDSFLSQVDLGDMLNSTQGQVVSLQKRFRVAGRNIGNFFLPYIQAVLQIFSKLNTESDDMLAKMIIITTGALSGVASILPTISPLLQLYDFLEMRIGNVGNTWRLTAKLFEVTKLKPFARMLQYIGSIFNDWLGIPILNFLKQFGTRALNIIQVPLVNYFDRLYRSIRRTYAMNILYNDTLRGIAGSMRNFGTNATSKVFGGIGEVIGKSAGKIMDFGAKYGNLTTKMRVATVRTNLWRYANLTSTDAIDKHNKAVLMSEKVLGRSTLWTRANNSALNLSNRLHNISFASKIRDFVASTLLNREKNKEMKQSIGAGIASMFQSKATDNLANHMTKLAIAIMMANGMTMAQIDEAFLSAGALEAEAIGAETASAGFFTLAGAEGIALWPVLLLVGAMVALFLIIDQIGKSLGWWDNWGEMIEAVWSGIQRLWAAFINNPNVQGLIKDIQGVFGALGGAIGWVAQQIMALFGFEDTGEEFDFVRFLIDGFGAIGRAAGDVVNAFKRVFGTLYSIVAPPTQAIWSVLRSIVCIIWGCSPGIIPALQDLQGVFSRVLPYIAMAITGPIGIIIGLFSGLIKGVDITEKIKTLGGKFFSVARHLGQMLWNGLNSIVGGIPQKVIGTFWTMINNLKQLPQQIWNTAQQFGQDIYNGVDSGISSLTGGLVHLPGAGGQAQAANNARTMGNATRNYNNVRQGRQGHTYNIHEGAIKLDARNMTTKESRQVMINALEGLTNRENVQTKKPQGNK